MKKMVLLLMFLVLVSSAYAIGGADIKASMLRYEPTPAEQGNTVDIWVQLSNIGEQADRVAIRFVPEYPFTLLAGQEAELDVGTVAATEDKVVKFTVFIDPNAPNGDRNITFMYKYSTRDEWVLLETPITLQTQDAILLVEDYTVTPSPVVPGQIVSVELFLRNAGRIGLKNIDVSLDIDDDKFSTVGTGTKKRINFIGPGQTKSLTFKLVSDTSTEVKVYSLPVSLSYLDERNKELSETAKISLVVNAEPELSLTVDATDFEKKTKPGTVSLKVVNKGIVDLKYVTVRLIQTPDYEILSPSNEAYVGNLDSDDFETVDFIVKTLSPSPRLNVQLEFKDPYNVDFEITYSLPLRIITDKDLGKQKFPKTWIFLALVVIVGGIYWWKKRRKKKR